MIDVIIPAYNAHETIRRTLSSIACQSIVNKLNVVIVNDASKKDYIEEVDFFSKFMNIKEIKLEKNSGPGACRQKGIDCTNSKYIVFIDSDDIFYSPKSLVTLYDAIETSNSDVIISSFYVENDNNEYIEEISNPTWLHGKIYKRDFLIENNIRFSNTYSNEDTGFNNLIYLLDSKIDYINDFTYVWCYNENSITRKNNARYKYTGIEGYIYNITIAVKSAIDRKMITNKLSELIFSTLVELYYYYLEYYNEKDIDEVLLKNSKELVNYYNYYHIDDNLLRNFIICNQYMYIHGKFTNIDLMKPVISFELFIKKILEY